MSAPSAATRSAVAALHFQRDICLPGGRLAPLDRGTQARFASAARHGAALVRAARGAGLPVMHVAFGRPEGGAFANPYGRLFRWITEVRGCIEGTVGHGFIPAMAPAAQDIVMGGNGTSAFTGSSLAGELGRWGVGRLVVCGITTHWTVESTVREASERGFDCVVAADACASASLAAHEEALERLSFIATVLPVAEILRDLGRPA